MYEKKFKEYEQHLYLYYKEAQKARQAKLLLFVLVSKDKYRNLICSIGVQILLYQQLNKSK